MTREEILSKAKPILFSTEMVRSILAGRKMVTRRPIKMKYDNTHIELRNNKYGSSVIEKQNDVEGETFGKRPDGTSWRKLLAVREVNPPYQVGDYLYVRETWAAYSRTYGTMPTLIYKADGNSPNGIKWHPSIHMPKEAARIFLRVTNVRVERLQDITADDCISEGVDAEIPPICKRNPPTEEQQRKYDNMTAEQQERYIHELAKHTYMGWCVYGDRLRAAFRKLWNSTIKKSDLDKYGWDANPWVWVIEFERMEVE